VENANARQVMGRISPSRRAAPCCPCRARCRAPRPCGPGRGRRSSHSTSPWCAAISGSSSRLHASRSSGSARCGSPSLSRNPAERIERRRRARLQAVRLLDVRQRSA
jgi:hypothetical protein